ncbi:nucleotidyltransferase domain-containing protein [Fusibacter bizertensis]
MMYGIVKSVWDSITNVLSQFDQVEQAVLYGSRAIGNFRNGSDIDLTLKGSKLNIDILIKIMKMIDDLDYPYEIDLSIYKDIQNQELKAHIDRVGIIIYRSLT